MLKNLFKSVETKSLFSSTAPVRTERLTLRAKRIDDLAADYRWARDADLCRLNATNTCSQSFAEYAILYEYNLKSNSRDSAKLAIDVDGKYIGNCVLYNIDFEARRAEYGIMIGNQRYWNRGLGAEATNAFTEHVFSSTPLHTLYLHTLTDNRAALKCFLKCGFTAKERVVREGYNFWFMELSDKEHAV